MEWQSILLVGCTLMCVLLLERTRQPIVRTLLNWVPAILFAYIIPAGVTHLLELDFSNVGLHSVSREVIMPLAILFVMSALSFRQLRAVGWRPILVFLSGSAAVALMPFVLLVGLRFFSEQFYQDLIVAEYWRGLVTMVGSWIGGSTSQLILKELSNCPESLFLVILVMDNALVNIWTILMFQKIKRSDAINNALRISDTVVDFIPDEALPNSKSARTAWLTTLVCISFVGLAYLLIASFLLKVIVLSVAGLLLGNTVRFWNHALVIKVGGYLIILIMAILGLKLNFSNFLLPYTLLVFSILWLISHYAVMIIVAYALNLHMAWVPIASMANVGGISTAPAVTKAYNEEWMPHAILLAVLSMVMGTYWGMLTIYLFQVLSS